MIIQWPYYYNVHVVVIFVKVCKSVLMFSYSALHTFPLAVKISLRYPSCRKPGTSKTGFGQVKIMKEFVWINRKFSNFDFRASRWKNSGKDCKICPFPPLMPNIFCRYCVTCSRPECAWNFCCWTLSNI